MSSTASAKLSRIVRAGAGAGKTHNLVEHVFDLLKSALENKTEAKIVVTTFTRKAAQELKERLLLKAIDSALPELIQRVSSPYHLHISTIHGVLSRFLNAHGMDLHLAPQFAMTDDLEELRLVKKLLRAHLAKNKAKVAVLLEEMRFEALCQHLRVLIRQCLFTNDPEVVSSSHLQELAWKRLTSFQVLAKRLADSIRAETEKETWIKYADHVDHLASGSVHPDWQKQCEFLGSLADQLPSVVNRGKIISESTMKLKEELNESLELLLSDRVGPEFAAKQELLGSALLQIAKDLAPEFLTQKISLGQLTMQDLEDFSWLLLEQSPVAAEKFSRAWTHWMIDEFQDTSPRQIQILEKLVGDSPVYMVGDPQQSIYLFRGARSEVFAQKTLEIQNAGGEQGLLMKNYRSSPTVMNFINTFFAGLSPQFSKMEIGFNKPVRDSRVDILIAQSSEDGESTEIPAALAQIQKLILSGNSPSSICVLARDNGSLLNFALEAAKQGLETLLHSSGRFNDRPEVRDALSFLKFLLNPHDNLNCLQVLRSPWLRLSDSQLLQVTQKKPQSYWAEIKSVFATEKSILQLTVAAENAEKVGISESWLNLMKDSFFIDSALHLDSSQRREANIWKLAYLLKSKERSPGFSYASFVEDLLQAEMDPEAPGADADAVPVVDPQRVNLMTVHGAKGLQFDHVLILGLGKAPRKAKAQFLEQQEETGQFCIQLTNLDSQKKEHCLFADALIASRQEAEAKEADRVLYVAMTRAIYTLTLIWGQKVAKGSWAERCPVTLAPGSHSDKDVHYQVHSEVFLAPRFMNKQSTKLQVLAPWQKPQANAASTSVTAMLESDSSQSGKNHAQTALRAIELAKRGTQTHSFFESLKYSPTQHHHFLQSSEFQFLREWGQGRLQQVIESGFVEWGFLVNSPKGLIQGQIDLWGRDTHGVYWILDYKTGSSRYKEKALRQLYVYLWALREMNRIPATAVVKLAVIYLSEEKIVEELAPAQDKLARELDLYQSIDMSIID